MRRIRTGGLVAAMESEDLINTDISPAEALPEAAESLETELLEVTDSQVEGEVAEAQVDEAVEVAEALESYMVTLSEITKQGGLDRSGAQILSMAVEGLCDRVGLVSKTQAPALESFGGVSSRVNATQLALEDIKGKAKEIWDNIVKAIKRAIQWVIDHFNKVFGGAEKLKKRAEATAKAAADTQGTVKDKKLENAGLVKKLHIGGTVSNAPAETARLAALVEGINKSLDTEIIKKAEELATTMGDPVKNAASFDITTIVPPINGGKEVGEAEGFGNAGNGMMFFRSDELPGGLAYVLRTAAKQAKGAEALELLARTSATITKFDPKAKEVTKADLEVLSTGDAEAIAKNVISAADALIAFRKVSDKAAKALKDAVSGGEKAAKSALDAEDTDGEAKKILNAARGAFANLPKFVIGGATAVTGYTLSTGKAYLDYVELSLKRYESSK